MRLLENNSNEVFPEYGRGLKDWKYYDVFTDTLKRFGFKKNEKAESDWWFTFPDNEIVVPEDYTEEEWQDAMGETARNYLYDFGDVLADALYKEGMPYEDAYSEEKTGFVEGLESIGTLEIFPESELEK